MAHVILLSYGVPLTASWMRQVEALARGEPGRPSYEVAFIDWGNVETVPAASVRAMSPALKAVDAQAAPATLAFVKARPGLADIETVSGLRSTMPPDALGLAGHNKASGSPPCPRTQLADVISTWQYKI